MTASAILQEAYLAKIVPPHLYGETQEKTLQARLAEDILHNRNSSQFFRTAPGEFFLTKFLSDESIPEKHRTPVVARRRARELHGDLELGMPLEAFEKLELENPLIEPRNIITKLNSLEKVYFNPRKENENVVFIWSFAVVKKSNFVLSYRVGRYRENRDTFLLKRSVGFTTPISHDDGDMFSTTKYGITESGVKAAKIDLDIADNPSEMTAEKSRGELEYFFSDMTDSQRPKIVAVVTYNCPEWFEPTRKRLAMHDVEWLDLSKPLNNLSEFDPWSQLVLQHEYQDFRAEA